MPTENQPTGPSFDLNTPDGGRGYIANLFKTVLKRHDYRQYIAERLAGDFACTLAQHLEDVKAREHALQQGLNAADQKIDELERDKARLDTLESNCWDVRFDSSPNGDAGDSSISIEIVGHWMDKPTERVIGENYSENLRAAIDQAMTAPAYPPERPEYPEATSDDEWHMNPCKQGHRDVGAAGGVAHCYPCDEKIEAATTQEAFEHWNATHPVAPA
ncbi:hypothetical protein [Pseudomonas sp. S2_F03]